MLELFVQLNLEFLSEYPDTPDPYSSGVVYEPEINAFMGLPEEFGTIPWCIKRGRADCDRLVAWRVAKLRQAGETRAACNVTVRRFPVRTRPGETIDVYHVTARRDDGSIEDPSAILGMGRYVNGESASNLYR